MAEDYAAKALEKLQAAGEHAQEVGIGASYEVDRLLAVAQVYATLALVEATRKLQRQVGMGPG